MNRKIDLEGRIEQYGATAQGQIGHRYTIGEIAGYAAAVSAGFAMAGTADAAIVYSGVLNNSISIPNAQATNNKDSFRASSDSKFAIGSANLYASIAFVASTFNKSKAKYVGLGDIEPLSNMRFMSIGGSHHGVELTSNSVISKGAAFGNYGVGFFNKETVNSKGASRTSFGTLALNKTGFVGFQLNNGDVGWIRLRLDDLGPNQPFSQNLSSNPLLDGQGFPDQLTVIDWAYTDGTSIRAGQTTVPDPSSLALLAAGALGLAAFRRRKAARAS